MQEDNILNLILILLLLLLTHSGRAHSGSDSPPPPDPYGNLNPSIGVVIVVLIAALFFMGLFYIFVRHCCSSSVSSGPQGRAIPARSRRAQRGLDRAVIDSFPTFDYSAVRELKIGKGALECAVCLNEFEDDDTLRFIPKCDHVFHPDCIDAWLVGHTTCPVCRTDLIPTVDPNESTHAPQNDNVLRDDNIVMEESNDDVEVGGGESMEEPLNGRMSRSRTMMRREGSIGRSRWIKRMRFARSFSTGHVAVKQWENMDRFTLRLPDEIRKQLMSGKLVRSTSMVVLPRDNSSRRGYRTGFGSLRSNCDGPPSNRWVFSIVPPFISRAPSSRQGSVRGSVRAGSVRVPV